MIPWDWIYSVLSREPFNKSDEEIGNLTCRQVKLLMTDPDKIKSSTGIVQIDSIEAAKGLRVRSLAIRKAKIESLLQIAGIDHG